MKDKTMVDRYIRNRAAAEIANYYTSPRTGGISARKAEFVRAQAECLKHARTIQSDVERMTFEAFLAGKKKMTPS